MGPLLLQLLRSRSSLHQRGSTPSGSEVPSWLHSPPSSRCGSPSRNMMSVGLPLYTGSASRCESYPKNSVNIIVVYQHSSVSLLQISCLLHANSIKYMYIEQ